MTVVTSVRPASIPTSAEPANNVVQMPARPKATLNSTPATSCAPVTLLAPTALPVAKAGHACRSCAQLAVRNAAEARRDPVAVNGTTYEAKVDGHHVNFRVMGKRNAVPAIPTTAPIYDKEILDVVVVGGGLAGLTAMVELKGTRAHLLEWESALGGLAATGRAAHQTYARGGAYFTEPSAEVGRFYHEIGLGSAKKVEIKGPIDSYLRKVHGHGNKRVYARDMWEGGLEKLPDGFRRFKEFLTSLDKNGMIGDVPFERETEKVRMFDKISAAELIKPFGPELRELLDLYCRSALGAPTDEISALAFLNFYIDEIGPRYAFPAGTGGVAEHIEKKLMKGDPRSMTVGAFVYDVHNRPDGLVEVRYTKDGVNHAMLAREAVMAMPLSTAQYVIKDLPAERKAQFNSIEHCNYLVHNIFTAKSVFDDSYDTWTNGVSFTDVIVGRWQATKGFDKHGSKKGLGILTVYQQLPRPYWNKTLTDEEVMELGKQAVKDLGKLFPKLKHERQLDVECMRWPKSIHIAKPGYVTGIADELRKPHGNVVFANNNLGVPEFEEAIQRGIMAAQDIRKRLARMDAQKSDAAVAQTPAPTPATAAA